ncbi:DUF1905 domain-containing protein [Nocardioides dilutus]
MLSIMVTIGFEAELWEHESQGAWCFVTVPEEPSEDIRLSGAMPAGFGSYRVEVTVGATTWRTSVFPASECFVLPVKKAVRRAEGIEVGDAVAVSLDVLLAE